MQCLTPVLVPNKARFFDISTKHPLLVYGRCGKCANCQQNNSAEWYFRALCEFEDTVKQGNYVQFVTLSYSSQYVPKLSYFEEFGSLTPAEDMFCFMSEDLRYFHSNLRSRLRRLGFPKDSYKYFIASEYGHDNLYRDHRGRVRRGTNRPHYHCLFYVDRNIDPLVFSAAVQKSWQFGLTDGIGDSFLNKSPQYVLNNTFYSGVVGGRKVVNYVSKYVQKSSAYYKKLVKRVKIVLHRLSNGDPFYLRTEEGKRMRRCLFDLSRQFHRQSLQFGASAIRDVDPLELYKVGYFVHRGSDGQLVRFPISQYFHRKLCYDKVWFDGSYVWTLKESALPLLELRKKSVFRNMSNYYKTHLPLIGKSELDSNVLVDYVLNYKGRNYAPFDEELLFGDLIDSSNRYVYNSPAGTIVSDKYLGNISGRVSGIGFDTQVEKLTSFIETHVIRDNFAPWCAGFDAVLDGLATYQRAVDNSQIVYDNNQLLKNKYKQLSLI